VPVAVWAARHRVEHALPEPSPVKGCSSLKDMADESAADRGSHFRGRRRLSAWRLRAGILWPTPRKRRMVSMNLGTEIGFDK
jgi:hypothetical protein